jgi:hypothetical protein
VGIAQDGKHFFKQSVKFHIRFGGFDFWEIAVVNCALTSIGRMKDGLFFCALKLSLAIGVKYLRPGAFPFV